MESVYNAKEPKFLEVGSKDYDKCGFYLLFYYCCKNCFLSNELTIPKK